MIRYALTRLVLLIVGLLVASVLIFATLRILPGDVAQLIAGAQGTPAQVAAIRERLNLDQPVMSQYVEWIGGLLRGDLGTGAIDPVAAEGPNYILTATSGILWAENIGCDPYQA